MYEFTLEDVGLATPHELHRFTKVTICVMESDDQCPKEEDNTKEEQNDDEVEKVTESISIKELVEADVETIEVQVG